MVDPGAAQALVKQLNRWYRQRAEPHGTIDHFYRGTRMSYTAAYRNVMCLFSLIMLSVASVLYFVPDIFADKSPWVILALKIGWIGIVVLAILAPLRAFREFTVVNDEGLIKFNLFGGETRLGWKEIVSFQLKPDDNTVIFMNNAKTKLTMSLAYDGWQDFEETAARHLSPVLYWQFTYALANVNAKSTIPRSTKKPRPAKWFSFGRKS
jgi:hypothetical protein